jgi:ubiquinone/menaquinone biosynthesis C-methylase UbiE
VFPWLNDKLTRSVELDRLRAEALSTARGRVIEIGFGSGANLAHYPGAVTLIVAIEPNEGMLDLAAPRIKASRIPVAGVVAQGESLPLMEGSFDTAVSTLTLCTVSEPARVLIELRRVLRAGGRLIVVEHGLSSEPAIARWQNRLNGIQNVIGCGCNLNRGIADLVERSGFEWQRLRQFYAERIPRTHGWITVGVAGIATAKAPVTAMPDHESGRVARMLERPQRVL